MIWMQPWLLIAAFGIGGVLLGWVYLRLLQISLTSLSATGGGMKTFVAFLLLRLCVFGGGVALAMYFGLWTFVAYAAGFILTRTIIVSRARAGIRVHHSAKAGSDERHG